MTEIEWNLPQAEFTVTSEVLEGEEWPDRTTDRTTLIAGELADMIREHFGSTGDVTLVEEGTEGGYSEWTQEEYWDISVFVGDQKVWETDAYEEFPTGRYRHDHLRGLSGGRNVFAFVNDVASHVREERAMTNEGEQA